MRISSRTWYQNSEHLSLFDIHFILSYITVDSEDHLLPSLIPAVCLKSLSWTFSWITAAHHGHQSANYFKEIICTLRQFVTCKNMCGGKYMFLKGRTPKMFLDESVKMSKHRWHDTDHEKVNLKLPWKKKKRNYPGTLWYSFQKKNQGKGGPSQIPQNSIDTKSSTKVCIYSGALSQLIRQPCEVSVVSPFTDKETESKNNWVNSSHTPRKQSLDLIPDIFVSEFTNTVRLATALSKRSSFIS